MNNISEVLHGHLATHIFEDDGLFPNNPRLPALVYKGALRLHPDDPAECILELFSRNGWTNGWKNGIYDYHHYHSNTHEVIGVFAGTVDVLLGGPEGVCVELTRGDVLILPAGVAHKNLKSSNDFLCVGAYPGGTDYDLNYGKPEERNTAINNIAQVPVPALDPVFGENGPLSSQWNPKK